MEYNVSRRRGDDGFVALHNCRDDGFVALHNCRDDGFVALQMMLD